MTRYLTIRNYLEREIGLAYRITDETEELYCNPYWKEDSWIPSYTTIEKILERYGVEFFELKWYNEEEFKALILMDELVS